MATPKTLRFYAKGAALVCDMERLANGVKAFIGRRYTEVEPGVWGFVPTGEAQQVPYSAEYVKACGDGDLHPADDETAEACAGYARAHGLPIPDVYKPAAPALKREAPAPAPQKGGDS